MKPESKKNGNKTYKSENKTVSCYDFTALSEALDEDNKNNQKNTVSCYDLTDLSKALAQTPVNTGNKSCFDLSKLSKAYVAEKEKETDKKRRETVRWFTKLSENNARTRQKRERRLRYLRDTLGLNEEKLNETCLAAVRVLNEEKFFPLIRHWRNQGGRSFRAVRIFKINIEQRKASCSTIRDGD